MLIILSVNDKLGPLQVTESKDYSLCQSDYEDISIVRHSSYYCELIVHFYLNTSFRKSVITAIFSTFNMRYIYYTFLAIYLMY